MENYSKIHEKAVRLCEGGAEWVNGLQVMAQRVADDIIACQQCEMDSACNKEMCDVCAECDCYDNHNHVLYFAK